jgi:hypothetical protein
MIQRYIINVKFVSLLGSEERLRSLPVGVRNGKKQRQKKRARFVISKILR